MKKLTIAVALALVVAAASGSAFAAHKYLVTSSSQIKPGTISLANLSPTARKALLSSTNAARGLQGAQGPAGATGAQGPAGPQGATGAAGGPGVSGYEVHTWRYSKDDANSDMGPGYPGVGSGAIATVACSPGKVALSGGYRFTSDHGDGFNSPALSDGSGVIASFPGRMDWTATPPTVKPNDNSGWIVQVNGKVNAADMTLYVVCANAK